MTANDAKLIYGELTERIIGSFYRVYNALGYGFLENVYAAALSLDLRNHGIKVEREVPVEVFYLGQPIARYRVDMLIEGKILIEIKSCAQIGETERRQVFNYLRSTKIEVALLLHFGPTPKHHRTVSTNKSFFQA